MGRSCHGHQAILSFKCSLTARRSGSSTAGDSHCVRSHVKGEKNLLKGRLGGTQVNVFTLPPRTFRRLLPIITVLAVAALVTVSFYSNATGTKTSVALEPYWPSPSLYVPGTYPPSAFLAINYTGSTPDAFYYFVTYNSTNGIMVAANGTAYVSQIAPYRLYLSIPLLPNETETLHANLYNGNSTRGSLIFSQSLVL